MIPGILRTALSILKKGLLLKISLEDPHFAREMDVALHYKIAAKRTAPVRCDSMLDCNGC